MIPSKQTALLFSLVAARALAAPQAYVTPAVSSTVAASGSKPTATIGETSYKCFKGTDFPTKSDWLTFDSLVEVNAAKMNEGNTPEIYEAIITDIKSVAKGSNVPPHLVLAQVMQESGGETNSAADAGKSKGLMQVQTTREPPIRCEAGSCTTENVLNMIQQGVNGQTTPGAPVAPGIGFWLGQYQASPGPALRGYNTGSVPDPAKLQIATSLSTESYVSDVANRLLGLAPEVFPSPQELQSLCGFKPAGT